MTELPDCGQEAAEAADRTFTKSELAEWLRAGDAECQAMARQVALTRRKIAALAKTEAAITEIEQVEGEMEALGMVTRRRSGLGWPAARRAAPASLG
jgi:hypothetical protein